MYIQDSMSILYSFYFHSLGTFFFVYLFVFFFSLADYYVAHSVSHSFHLEDHYEMFILKMCSYGAGEGLGAASTEALKQAEPEPSAAGGRGG